MASMALNLLAGAAFSATINFDNEKAGELPSGWRAGVTGKGTPQCYPWCVKKDVSLEDGFVEVKFKPISGREDQAAGLIWRWQNGDNYYIARANALEDNVTIYHTIKGKRTEKKRASRKVVSNQWHILRVDFHGNKFKVSFDGQAALEWEDDTFKEAGAVGIWTKADSVILFDDFSFGSQ